MLVKVVNWDIHRTLGPGYDPIAPHGEMVGHPSVNYGSPGAFLSFDKETGIGISSSGRSYHFERISFRSTGFAKTYEEAMDWLGENWVMTK